VSIETRKERGEAYSALAGFFKQFELVYVVADERDVIRVRTTYRRPQEDVYVYRLRAPRENIRRAFLDYLRAINDLRDPPVLQHPHDELHDGHPAARAPVNPASPP
jgi:hypothetical protein